jgi:uncharacterized protein (DUF433 family)
MTSLLNTGIYAVPEAARIIHVPAWRIRRWLRGYEFNTKGGRHSSPSVWRGQLQPLGGKVALGFRDLLEARCIDAFIEAGVSWSFLRKAHVRARQLIGHDHPFCTNRFSTDGKTIFFETREASTETCLWDMVDLQRVFDQIIRPFLQDVEYDEGQTPARWWPCGKDRSVTLDPLRSFGQPIIHTVGIPTRVLADSVAGNGSVEEVARWFEAPLAAVVDAVAYEKTLAAA